MKQDGQQREGCCSIDHDQVGFLVVNIAVTHHHLQTCCTDGGCMTNTTCICCESNGHGKDWFVYSPKLQPVEHALHDITARLVCVLCVCVTEVSIGKAAWLRQNNKDTTACGLHCNWQLTRVMESIPNDTPHNRNSQ